MAADREVHLTCEKCSTVYRLDPARLGVTGRTVRCMQCLNMWYQPPPEGVVPAPAPLPAEETPPARPVEHYGLDENMRVIPDSVIPDAVVPESDMPGPPPGEMLQLPVMTHRPMGMGAAQFGIFTFLLLGFTTLIGLMLAKQPLVKAYPPLLAVYDALGVGVPAPGEGLRLSAMLAESHTTGSAKALHIEAKLENISEHETAYPAIHLKVAGPYGATLKEWDWKNKNLEGNDAVAGADRKLLPGETVPVKLTFANPPAGGKTAELTITGN